MGVNLARWLAVACCAGLAVGTPHGAHAQVVATGTRTEAGPTRTVTVNVENAVLKVVLQDIAQQASLSPFFGALVENNAKRVTLHVKDVSVIDAFQYVLAGTGIRATIASGRVVFERDGAVSVTAGTGSVMGRVIEDKSGRPVAGASVVIDSMRPVRTRDNGTFVVSGVAVGAHKVVVRALGYRVMSMPVTVKEDATATISVALTPSATVLNDVVTTATGDRRRLEVGNAIGTINADSVVKTTLIRNVSDLLQARLPGVLVQNTSGMVGAPSKIRIRGINSLVLNNDPIIILDGIRLNAQTSQARNQTNHGDVTMLSGLDQDAGQRVLAPSRLDDIDPNTIESIDVLRGPSASSLYGTEAANGVIIIKTKRGHAGPWRATVHGDNGWSNIPGTFGDLWWGFGKIAGNLVYSGACVLAVGGQGTVTGHTCVQDSVRNFNYENDPDMRTFGTGTAQSIGMDLSGGSDALRQFFSLGMQSNVGMAKMSNAQQRLIGRLWNTPAPSWMKRPNTEQNIDGKSNTTFQIAPSADVSLNAQAIYRNDLNGGSGVIIPTQVGQGMSPGDTLGIMPSQQQRTRNTSLAKRGVLASSGHFTPWQWLNLTGTTGGDYTLRSDEANIRAQDCTAVLQVVNHGPNSTCRSGRNTRRDETFVKTANVGAQLSFSPLSWVTSRTSLGEQYGHTDFYSLQVGAPFDCTLAFGSTLLTPAPICPYSNENPYTVSESQDQSATAGVYVEESLGLFGLFVTTGIRRDVSSGFGSAVNRTPPNYPKFDLSYPISEQSFFPKQSLVSSLRLRVAYGQSGNAASQSGTLNTYQQQQELFGPSNTPTAIIVMTGLGNRDLKPERGVEWEGGFDLSLFERERVRVGFTMYRKFTRDAINWLPIASSYGLGTGTLMYANLGDVENRGLEATVDVRPIDSRLLTWNLTINGTKNTSKLVHKAQTLRADGQGDTRNVEGYPLFGYWGIPVASYADANHNGILEPQEVMFGPSKYLGSAAPRGELTYANSIGLFNGTLHVGANFDQVLGQVTVRYIDSDGGRPRAAVDPTAPLAEQAGWIQAVVNFSDGHGGNTQGAEYFSEASTLRFNELSVAYDVPAKLVQRLLHGRALQVTVAARNLALWTNYVGKDPNVSTQASVDEFSFDFGTGVSQPRNVTLRFNLSL